MTRLSEDGSFPPLFEIFTLGCLKFPIEIGSGSNRSTYCQVLLVDTEQRLVPFEASILRTSFIHKSMWVSHLFLLEAKDTRPQKKEL